MKKYFPLFLVAVILISAVIFYLTKEKPEPVVESNQLYQGVSDNSLEGYYEMSQQINNDNQSPKDPNLNMSEVLLNKNDGTQNLDNQTTIPVIINEGSI